MFFQSRNYILYIAANYYIFLVITYITNILRNYESTICFLNIKNFLFSTPQKKSPW